MKREAKTVVVPGATPVPQVEQVEVNFRDSIASTRVFGVDTQLTTLQAIDKIRSRPDWTIWIVESQHGILSNSLKPSGDVALFGYNLDDGILMLGVGPGGGTLDFRDGDSSDAHLAVFPDRVEFSYQLTEGDLSDDELLTGPDEEPGDETLDFP